MKIQSLKTKIFWLVLVCTTVVVVTIFRLSPSFARATITPPAQISTAGVTVAQDASPSGEESLYERLGGYNVIAAVIDDVAAIATTDPLIEKYFFGLSNNAAQRLRQHLVDQVCQAAGGPCIYTGRSMRLSHNGMGDGITNSDFDALLAAIAQSCDKNGVNYGEKEELVAFANSFRGEIVERL